MSVVIKGKVTVKVHGMLKQKQLPGNWAVLYDGGGKDDQPPNFVLYDESDQASPLHTIILEHLKFPDKSFRQPEPFFLLSIKKDKHQFQFEDVESKEEWVLSFCHVSQDLWKQWASGRESSVIESDNVDDMSDNLLYDSFSKAQEFKVSINPTKASEANDIRGHYLVSPTKDSLRLMEMDTSKCLHEWSYRQIRKYGNTRKVFRLEVGRSCSTGPGEFEFFTPEGQALSELIAMYTRQRFNQDHKSSQAQAAAAPPEETVEYVDSLTASQKTSDLNAQQSLPPATPRRTSEIKDSKGKESRLSQRVDSQDSKQEAPKPVPRSSLNKSRKESSSANGTSKAPHSSKDTKIYETSSGLTAPLDSHLKHELHTKLQVQPSPTQQAPSKHTSVEIEDDPVSDSVENSTGSRGSTESIKDKKKMEKERKKLEKEQKAAEAKRKKQQEKEQKEKEKMLKEQKEKEAKEERERQKKLKKESKVHEKLISKKSLDTPAPMPARLSEGNIYDEPEELLKDTHHAPSSQPVDSGYCEAGDIIPALQHPPKSASAEVATSDVYAIPQKPKDSWKTRARPESQQIHQENYDAIKQVSRSLSRSPKPPIPPHPQSCLPGAEDVDDTYNHLGDFRPVNPAHENVYGMASGKDIVGENMYEDASTVSIGLNSKQGAQEVRDDYEQTAAPQEATINISVASEGDYAEPDVSHT